MSPGDQRAAFVDAARAMVGTRYRPGGRDGHGLDCVGLVFHAARLAGLDVPAWPSGRREVARGGLVDAARSAGWTLAPLHGVASAQAGDVLVRWPHPGRVHLAIRSADALIEADARLRRVVERTVADDEVWQDVVLLPMTGGVG